MGSLHRHGHRRPARLRFHRGAEPLVGEQRRIDPSRQVPEIVERLLQTILEMLEQIARLVRVGSGHAFGDPRLDG